MGSPSDEQQSSEVDSSKINVKRLFDQKFRVTFLKNAPVPKQQKSYFNFGTSRPQSPKGDGLTSYFETLGSTKESNARDFKSGFERSTDRSDTKTFVSEPSQQVCDDYISIHDKSIRISKIGIYSSYYILGIKIEFETSDLKTFSTFHGGSNFNIDKDPKTAYKEMVLEEDEYIEHVFGVKSAQTNYIRNMTLITNQERNLCIEGEIEIYDIAKTSPRDGFIVRQKKSRDIKNELIQSFSMLDEDVSPSDSKDFKKISKELEGKSIILEGEDDDFYVRKQSIGEGFRKNQDCNLRYIQHRLIGLKTAFANGYLEDIQLYTAENDRHKQQLIEHSHKRNNFVFI